MVNQDSGPKWRERARALPVVYETILEETFQSYRPGPFSEGYSAIGEVHYPPRTIEQGPWEEISTHYTFNLGNKVRWVITASVHSGRQVLRQTGHYRHGGKNWKGRLRQALERKAKVLFFPGLACGDPMGKDYRVEALLRVDSTQGLCGLIFRMVDARHHYLLGVRDGRIALSKRDGDSLESLVSCRMPRPGSQEMRLAVCVEGKRIECFVDEKCHLEYEDISYPRGRVGLLADVPAEFAMFRVIAAQGAAQASPQGSPSPAPKQTAGMSDPRMRLLKAMPLPGPCSGRSIRWGDLTGSGNAEFLLAQGTPIRTGNNYNNITCLTMADHDGRVLWRRGKPHAENRCLCSDLPVQIYDIDGDGRAEVICSMQGRILILDGCTGEEKRSVAVPRSVPPHNALPEENGDAILVCNLDGAVRPRHILFKDRHTKVWVFDAELNICWEYRYRHGELGHFPFPADLDGDGCDEILLGNVCLDQDGKELWDLRLKDHADAVAVFREPHSGRDVIAIAASDEGFFLVDTHGKILSRSRLGHMQTVIIARVIPDAGPFQLVTNTYWGNPGVTYTLDTEGRLLHSFQCSCVGSPLCPVRWLGNGLELLLLSAAPDTTGGLYDGRGSQVVSFPDDGHPTLCCDARDLNGDGIDELICWDHERLWIYARENGPEPGVVAGPVRHQAECNQSNYQSHVSVGT
ncbi:MAG: rhamnogalacturonan lyase family protein [Candidatus Geothermincolia bacterium]